MQEQLSIENQFSFYEKNLVMFLKKTLKVLNAEYEAKDLKIFHSKWRRNQG